MKISSAFLLLLASAQSLAQRTATLGLADGFLSFNTPSFKLELVKDSQTLASLKPVPSFANNPLFDFAPFDQLTLRQYNGNYHFGDVTFRVRKAGSSAWISGGEIFKDCGSSL